MNVELARWETDVAPGMGRPQALVNAQIKPYDIFLGIMSRRFGSPSGVAGSGTEEEFRIAFHNWQKHGKPWIAFYFNNTIDPARTDDEKAQLERVNSFKAQLNAKGLLGEYNGEQLFPSTVRPHLLQIVGLLIQHERDVKKVIKRLPHRTAARFRGLPIPLGAAVTISGIGPQDACYHQRDKYIGRAGVILEGQAQGRWLMGTFCFDVPLFEGDDRRYEFLQFQIESTKSKRPGARQSKA